jgi:hypothetical protein
MVFAGIAPVAGQDASVNGRLRQVGPYRSLIVWGTPDEMGYAHGYLLARELKTSIARRIDAFRKLGWNEFDETQRNILSRVAIPEDVERELRGVLRGMNDALDNYTIVESLQRRINMDDLRLRNSEDLIRGFGCSGFTVWGDRAGKDKLITGRNFDFSLDSPASLGEWLILVRQPTGRMKVATVTIPGYLGAFTGWNEEGVCTFMHDGSGGSNAQLPGKTVPLALALTGLLEESSAGTVFARARKQLPRCTPYAFPYMARVIAPVVNADLPPVHVFRVDQHGISENPVHADMCVTTNHYLDESFHAPTNEDNWSTTRYDRITSAITSEDNLARDAAWETLGRVAVRGDKYYTLHSLVVYPLSMQLDIAMARFANRVIAAPDMPPTTITFDQLFGPYD